MHHVLTARARRWFVAVPMLTGVALAGATLPSPSGARADITPLAFSGSAVADGVEMTFHSPGFPVSDTPLDAGGPTTSAAVNTYGTSQASATYPDPGSLPASAPGLVAGLLGAGAAGLPPIALPQIPAYPFAIQSDATLKPDATAGAGPYVLEAHSTDAASNASARAGGQADAAGNAVLTSSSSSVARSADGGVVALATSDVQGLTIGPLTIGEVHTTAKEVADPTGSVTPTTTAEISGMKIAGLPIDVDANGFNVGGVPVPVPISSTLNALLSAAKITLTIKPASTNANTAASPALIISMPADLTAEGLGTGPGYVSMTLGATSAQLDTGGVAAPGGSYVLPVTPPPPSTTATSPVASPGSSTPVTTTTDAGTPGSLVTDPSVVSPPAVTTPGNGQSPVIAPSPGLVTTAAGAARNPTSFDLSSLYLILVAGAAAALVLSQLTRRLGVRRPWTSNAG